MDIRGFECAECGAPGEFSEGALLILCRYCGSFLAIEAGAVSGGELVRLARAQRGSFAAPSRLQARLMTLAADLEDRHRRGDRAGYRALAGEQQSLLLATTPALAASVPGSAARAEWLKETVAAMEHAVFDPDGIAAQARYGAAAAAFARSPDPLEAARALLAAAREYSGPAGPGAERRARELVRASVTAMASLLGEGVAPRIFAEVLGDRAASAAAGTTCWSCGASLPEPAAGRRTASCPYCGASFAAADADPWLEQVRASFQLALDDIRRQGQVSGPAPALGILSQLLLPFSQGRTVSVDTGWRLLRETVPWLAAGDLETGIRLRMGGLAESAPELSFLRGLLERLPRWVAEPAQTPGPWEPPRNAAADRGAWVEQSLALHRLSAGGKDPQTLLGWCLSPFHLGGSIDAEQALSFIRSAAPECDPAGLLRQIDAFRPGFRDRPDITAFLESLRSRLA